MQERREEAEYEAGSGAWMTGSVVGAADLMLFAPNLRWFDLRFLRLGPTDFACPPDFACVPKNKSQHDRFARRGRRQSDHATMPTLISPVRDAAANITQAPHAAACAPLRGARSPRFGHLVQRLEHISRQRRPQRSHRVGGSLRREAMSSSTGWRGVTRAGQGGGCAWAGAAPDPAAVHHMLRDEADDGLEIRK
jgi:hypothetical protein